MNRYNLKKIADGEYMLTDNVERIVITFQEHQFNETQKVDLLSGSIASPQKIATAMRQAGDWLAMHYYSVAMPTPVNEVQLSEDNKHLYVIRHKHPKFRVEIEDLDATGFSIGNALKKAGEYIKHYYGDFNFGLIP